MTGKAIRKQSVKSPKNIAPSSHGRVVVKLKRRTPDEIHEISDEMRKTLLVGSTVRFEKVDLKTRRVPLNEVVSGGWKALVASTAVTTEQANDPTLPSIVLVSFGKDRPVKKSGETPQVRLDLGKGMFLDSTPVGVRREDGHRLAETIAAKWTKSSGEAR